MDPQVAEAQRLLNAGSSNPRKLKVDGWIGPQTKSSYARASAETKQAVKAVLSAQQIAVLEGRDPDHIAPSHTSATNSISREDAHRLARHADEVNGLPAGTMESILQHESRLKNGRYQTDAKAPSSSATGLYQFIDSTWKEVSGRPLSERTNPVIMTEVAGRHARTLYDLVRKYKPDASTDDVKAYVYIGWNQGAGALESLLRTGRLKVAAADKQSKQVQALLSRYA